jgi:hypothetical protein
MTLPSGAGLKCEDIVQLGCAWNVGDKRAPRCALPALVGELVAFQDVIGAATPERSARRLPVTNERG